MRSGCFSPAFRHPAVCAVYYAVYCTGRERKSNDRFPTEMIPLSCPGKFPLSSSPICHAGFGRKVQSENGTYGLCCWCVWNVLISLCAIQCKNRKKILEPDGGGGVCWCWSSAPDTDRKMHACMLIANNRIAPKQTTDARAQQLHRHRPFTHTCVHTYP